MGRYNPESRGATRLVWVPPSIELAAPTPDELDSGVCLRLESTWRSRLFFRIKLARLRAARWLAPAPYEVALPAEPECCCEL